MRNEPDIERQIEGTNVKIKGGCLGYCLKKQAPGQFIQTNVMIDLNFAYTMAKEVVPSKEVLPSFTMHILKEMAQSVLFCILMK
jgi:hypothetical protein